MAPKCLARNFGNFVALGKTVRGELVIGSLVFLLGAALICKGLKKVG